MPGCCCRQVLLPLGNVLEQQQLHSWLDRPHATFAAGAVGGGQSGTIFCRRRRCRGASSRHCSGCSGALTLGGCGRRCSRAAAFKELVQRQHVPNRVLPGPFRRLEEREISLYVVVYLANRELRFRPSIKHSQTYQAGEGEGWPCCIQGVTLGGVVRRTVRPIPRGARHRRTGTGRVGVAAAVCAEGRCWRSRVQLTPAPPPFFVHVRFERPFSPKAKGEGK